MEARNANLVLCALVKEAKRIDDPRYQFDMEEEDGVVVKCTINNAEVLDVPGVEYQLHPSETEENRLDSLEVIIKDNNKKFSEIFRQLPYGIIKKNATGIGATTLALTAKNNCVIVCPTRNLAYEKYCKGVTKTGEKQYLYVGSGIGDIKKVEDSHIRNYLKNNNIPYKKILVVADSLPRLMTFLPRALDNWHIMVDEIDSYQTDGVYRPALELVIDYFCQKFPERNRCLVSATVRPFSDPRLANLPVIDVRYEQLIRRPIKMLRVNNIPKAVAVRLQAILRECPDDKIVVAYNKIASIRIIIDLLPEKLRDRCEIWCSSQSEQQAGVYYPEHIGTHLTKQITFLTCTHFTGVDIEDRYHLISVSDTQQLYTLLSPEKLLQIAGRCRHRDGLLSELFIYDIQSKKKVWGGSFDKQHNIACAEWIIQCLGMLNKGVENFNDVIQGNVVRAVASQVSEWRVTYGGSTPIVLVRYDIDKKLAVSYLNIDALDEFVRLRSRLYTHPGAIIKAMQTDCDIVSNSMAYYKQTDAQRTVTGDVKNEMKAIENANIDEHVRIMKQYAAEGKLTPDLVALVKRRVSRESKPFLTRFHDLMPYAPYEFLIDTLSSCRTKKNKWYKGFYNAVLFNALEDKHPFRLLVENSFKQGERYSKDEVHLLMVAIFNASGLKVIAKPATAVSYLQSFCTLRRGRDTRTGINYYRVIDYQSKKYFGKTPVNIARIVGKFDLIGGILKLK